jgi:DNA-binding winged helix-turn-helix (wHTH) protein
MIEFPPFRLDPENQCLWRGAERISFTPKAFVMLEYLVERAGRLVTHDELLAALWPDSFVQPDVLKSHILDIRHALGDDAKAPVFIETQPRRGYRFHRHDSERRLRTAELWILYTMRKPEAVDRARALIQLFPSLPICRFASGLALLRTDLTDEAVTTFEEGLKIVPGDVFLLGVLA